MFCWQATLMCIDNNKTLAVDDTVWHVVMFGKGGHFQGTTVAKNGKILA